MHGHARQTLGLIAAVAANGVIGDRGRLPWHYPEDLAHFKRVTMGHVLVMGRVTYEHLPRTLAGRHVVVLSRSHEFSGADVETCHSLEAVLSRAEQEEHEVIVCGGATVYAGTLPYVRRMYLTRIDRAYDGDTSFPDYDADEWQLTRSEECGELRFDVLERRAAS
jgi:dihydrofolate reductase